MKHTLTLLLIILISGCITPGKVSTYLEKPKNKPEADVIVQQYLSANELLAASFCARTYPVKESTDTNTETQKGNTEDFQDETGKALAEADKELENLNNKPIDQNCAPCVVEQNRVIAKLQSTIRNLNEKAQNLKPDTKTKTITRYVENTAKVEAVALELAAQKDSTAKYAARLQVTQEDLKAEQGSKNRYFWLCVALVVGLAVVLFLLFRR